MNGAFVSAARKDSKNSEERPYLKEHPKKTYKKGYWYNN